MCLLTLNIFVNNLFLIIVLFFYKATDYLNSDYKTVNISIFQTSSTTSSEIDLTAMYDTITPSKVELLAAL